MAHTPSLDDYEYPLAAQIPLQTFVLPIFPPHASRLRELTLTSDIKLDEYQELIAKHEQERREAQQQQEQVSPPAGRRGSRQGSIKPDYGLPSPVSSPPTKPPHIRKASLTAATSLIYHAPNIPSTITSLTLELFSLGFPAGWLSSVDRSLPKLKSLVLFASLVDGLNEDSREDAVTFLKGLVHNGETVGGKKALRDLHVIDTFARPGFWRKVAENVASERIQEAAEREHSTKSESQLQFLEMSYTYRGHSDPEFMARVTGDELPDLLGNSLIAASFNLAPPPPPPPANPSGEDPQSDVLEDPANIDEEGQLFDNKRPEGIVPFSAYGRATAALRKRMERLGPSGLPNLKMLNLTLWSLRPVDVGQILSSCASSKDGGGLVDLAISLLLEDHGVEGKLGWWDQLLKSLSGKCPELDALEVVGVPGDDDTEQISASHVQEVFEQAKDVERLRLACPKLTKFEMNILRAGSFGHVQWVYDSVQEKWTGGFVAAEVPKAR